MAQTGRVLPSYDAELAVATEAARRAGKLQLERYERLERIVHKGDRDVVTEVDTLSEDMIIGALRGAFPTDAFLAEESGRSEMEADRIWVIDPLDGTVNYANGIPVFCVSIGLAVGGKPVVGVVHDPVRNETFTAVTGRGAQLDGKRIRHPRKAQMSDLVVSMSFSSGAPRAGGRNLRKQIRVTRNLGSAALSLAYVGNGRFDGFIQIGGLSAWDICAAGLIALEGGATITARDGGPWFDIARKSRSIGIVAAAPAHHATFLELLA